MTIRRILLAAFLLVSLVPATALTLLAFDQTQAAMLGEIEQGVTRSAASLSSDIDRFLSERLLNATTWNHLEVMQDLRLDDVDKRLSSFLSEMKTRYGGAYVDLLALDRQGRVIASSSASRIGLAYPTPDVWYSSQLQGGEIRIDRVRDGHLSIRTPIESLFTEGQLGELVLELDWKQIESILDATEDSTRHALLMGPDSVVIAASSELRDRGAEPGTPAPGWLESKPRAIRQRNGLPWMDSQFLVGSARSVGTASFTGFGWTTLLLESKDVALTPVRQMAWIFAGLLAATILVTVAASLWVAGIMARPIAALTDYTRRYMLAGPTPAIPAEGPGEIGELNRSFVKMVEEVQRSQSTLTQASQLAALGEITALLAHEVRTPLGILRSSAQLLRIETRLSPEGAELVRIVESETERLNRLVSSMLDSGRARPPQRRNEDVHAIIRHAAALLASQTRARQITIEMDLRAEDAFSNCDSEQITQVLLNLVMNALQVLPVKGHISITTQIDIDRLNIEVGDDGPGIVPEDRVRIFEPFVFKREGGIGLGLAVVRQILRQHGGDIIADRAVLGGALFRFWLPRSEGTT